MEQELSGRASVRRIAEVLDLSDDDVLRALGGGWRLTEDPLLSSYSGGWFVTGEPMQVLLGVGGSTLTLARVGLRWGGPGTVSMHTTEEREYAHEDVLYQPELLGEAVEELARKTRRTFRWCRTCRTVNRPEDMQDRLNCMACASEYGGAVN
ncbi:hypothetical protein [Modestobacter altitudinis]|uniref:hypothetical protein n=1 Tax=Modestobacter altitudinis TaxID=2213158 RepID=UPI00110CEFC5|nr:hypothetical protein [Modestobacter altitudinis]